MGLFAPNERVGPWRKHNRTKHDAEVKLIGWCSPVFPESHSRVSFTRSGSAGSSPKVPAGFAAHRHHPERIPPRLADPDKTKAQPDAQRRRLTVYSLRTCYAPEDEVGSQDGLTVPF